MLKNPFDLSFEQLPGTLPVFPLDNQLLLPGGQLPLNVFEVRYINLIQDALAAKDRMIGIVMPSAPVASSKTPLFDVGCAGRVTSFEETVDGRFIVVVTGYCRFRIKEEIATTRGYRRIRAMWREFEGDLTINAEPDIPRKELIDGIKKLMKLLQIDMDWMAVEGTPSYSIVSFFSMSLPFSANEKQYLLECKTIEDRAASLLKLVKKEISLREALKGK